MVSMKKHPSTLSNEGWPEMLLFKRKGKVSYKKVDMYCKSLVRGPT